MARNPRVVVPGYAYHLTQRGSNRQPVFRSIADRKIYLSLLRDNTEDAGIRLLSYCLMTNHVHLVAVPRRGDSLSVWMRRVHGRYAQYFNAKTNRSGHLWQARFFSCALSPGRLTVALRYVEQNPVRAQLVQSPEQYRWSSAGEHMSERLAKGSMLDEQEWRERGGKQGWTEMLGMAPMQPLVHSLRRCTFGGRPCGNEEFVRQIEEKSGCAWRRWPYEQELRDDEILLSLDGDEDRAKSADSRA